MGGCDKIDVMAAQVRELNHHRGHLFGPHIGSLLVVTDLIVLAEVAQEVAGADENRSRTMDPYQRSFFTKVSIIARHPRLSACLTKSCLSLEPVYAATSGTEET